MCFVDKYKIKIVTVAEAEAEHMVSDERLGEVPVAFGFGNKAWKTLIEQIQEGDELWEFNSPEHKWREGMGSAGYVLLRNGEVVGSHVTRMN